jgi:hypothetical protein
MEETTTIRDQIMESIVARFQAQRAGTDNARITWDVVSRDPLSENQKQEGNSLCISDTTERVKQIVRYDEKWLTVIIEIYTLVKDGDSPSQNIQLALGEVQRVMGLDNTCGGLGIDLVEQGTDVSLGIPSDRIAVAAAGFTVRYRNQTGNPFLK